MNPPRTVAFNPFAQGSASEIERLLRELCAPGLSDAERSELDDQIEALVPALIELRDAGHLALTARTLAESATLQGLVRLASDTRLSELSRNRCAAVRDRLLVQGIRILLRR